jgi:hypothetical protein
MHFSPFGWLADVVQTLQMIFTFIDLDEKAMTRHKFARKQQKRKKNVLLRTASNHLHNV